MTLSQVMAAASFESATAVADCSAFIISTNHLAEIRQSERLFGAIPLKWCLYGPAMDLDWVEASANSSRRTAATLCSTIMRYVAAAAWLGR
jgi:hypothetical protein